MRAAFASSAAAISEGRPRGGMTITGKPRRKSPAAALGGDEAQIDMRQRRRAQRPLWDLRHARARLRLSRHSRPYLSLICLNLL